MTSFFRVICNKARTKSRTCLPGACFWVTSGFLQALSTHQLSRVTALYVVCGGHTQWRPRVQVEEYEMKAAEAARGRAASALTEQVTQLWCNQKNPCLDQEHCTMCWLTCCRDLGFAT